MANVAILIGNSEYETLGALTCCEADVLAIKELTDATEKFESVEVILNSTSSQLKDRIRNAFDNHKPIAEVFLYFTGHGFSHEAEFFFCSTNFDSKRPNETGLSNSELHILLRSLDADLVVKVIDACSSGTLLVKSDDSFLPTHKHGFKNLIQIASCLDSQNALTGNPLSVFTEKFRAAALRKREGTVYYTDIIDTLRDEFLDSDSQTPHFVSQGTGREQFVETAKRFDELRANLLQRMANARPGLTTSEGQVSLSPIEILERADGRFAKKELAQDFISRLFDKLTSEVSANGRFGQLFSSELVEHSDFTEPAARDFIVRVLSGEKRPDNFVTASTSYGIRDDLFGLSAIRAAMVLSPAEAAKHYFLRLNCTLDKVQLKITFSPRFVTLKQFVLVVSCAPSLEHCYVMEILTQHALVNWGVFDSEGLEVVRRWYKMNWTDNCDGLVNRISSKLKEIVDEGIAGALKSLSA